MLESDNCGQMYSYFERKIKEGGLGLSLHAWLLISLYAPNIDHENVDEKSGKATSKSRQLTIPNVSLL